MFCSGDDNENVHGYGKNVSTNPCPLRTMLFCFIRPYRQDKYTPCNFVSRLSPCYEHKWKSIT